MVIDCHWHTKGTETASQVAKAVDAARLDRVVALSPNYADGVAYPGMPIAEANRWIADLAQELPDRVIGFGWIEPTLPGAVDEAERCINDYGLRGFKIIPKHWYPTDESVFPVYAKIEELGVPILFHSGILYGYGDSSRFCRPVFYEALIHFAGVRFALAHIGWPWVDECLAVYSRFKAQWERHRSQRPEVSQIQMYVDVTRGAPPAWREDALRKAVAFVGPDHLIWGSDASSSNPEYARQVHEGDRRILASQVGVPPASLGKIFGGNMASFLGGTRFHQ